MQVRTVRVHADALQGAVGNLVLERQLVLSIEVVPDLNPTVLGDHEEHTLTCGRPTTVTKVGVVELGSHDWSLELIVPNLSCPITDGQEVMEHRRVGVPLTLVDWSQVPSALKSESGHDLDWLLLSSVDLAD